MAEATNDDVRQQLLTVLHEAYEGPSTPWTYFTDRGPEAALFGALATLTADQAARPLNGRSIAEHVAHVAFGNVATTEFIQGVRRQYDWNSSWDTGEVDEAGWTALRDKLRSGYQELRRTIESNGMDSAETVGGCLAAATHAAYHLGAIRQKMALLRSTT